VLAQRVLGDARMVDLLAELNPGVLPDQVLAQGTLVRIPDDEAAARHAADRGFTPGMDPSRRRGTAENRRWKRFQARAPVTRDLARLGTSRWLAGVLARSVPDVPGVMDAALLDFPPALADLVDARLSRVGAEEVLRGLARMAPETLAGEAAAAARALGRPSHTDTLVAALGNWAMQALAAETHRLGEELLFRAERVLAATADAGADTAGSLVALAARAPETARRWLLLLDVDVATVTRGWPSPTGNAARPPDMTSLGAAVRREASRGRSRVDAALAEWKHQAHHVAIRHLATARALVYARYKVRLDAAAFPPAGTPGTALESVVLRAAPDLAGRLGRPGTRVVDAWPVVEGLLPHLAEATAPESWRGLLALAHVRLPGPADPPSANPVRPADVRARPKLAGGEGQVVRLSAWAAALAERQVRAVAPEEPPALAALRMRELYGAPAGPAHRFPTGDEVGKALRDLVAKAEGLRHVSPDAPRRAARVRKALESPWFLDELARGVGRAVLPWGGGQAGPEGRWLCVASWLMANAMDFLEGDAPQVLADTLPAQVGPVLDGAEERLRRTKR
jgi:hypothetical protein